MIWNTAERYACICLYDALHMSESKKCLMVGNTETGYIVVPHSGELKYEIERRCIVTKSRPLCMGTVIHYGNYLII